MQPRFRKSDEITEFYRRRKGAKKIPEIHNNLHGIFNLNHGVTFACRPKRLAQAGRKILLASQAVHRITHGRLDCLKTNC